MKNYKIISILLLGIIFNQNSDNNISPSYIASFGSVTMNDKVYNQISFTPEIPINKKIGLGLEFYLYFDENGDYLKYLRKQEPRTLRGEKVKSFEELLIADWLTLNDVEYEYEYPYEHKTASRKKRQYKPDFFIKDSGIYLEHFGVGRNGKTAPGIDERKYAEDMAWKRNLHAENRTKLIETYSWERQEGILLDELHRKLTEAGVHVDPSGGKQVEKLMSQREINKKLIIPEGKLLKISMQRMAFAAKNENDAKEKNKLAYEYYKRFDNVFTGPGKVKGGKVEPLPRKQSLQELTENLLICPTDEMIDKLSVYAEAGVDEIIISAGFGQSQNEMIESMYRISEEVIPYFKKLNIQVA